MQKTFNVWVVEKDGFLRVCSKDIAKDRDDDDIFHLGSHVGGCDVAYWLRPLIGEGEVKSFKLTFTENK